MNQTIVQNQSILTNIVAKDFHFVRWPLLGYLIIGLLALTILASLPEKGFYLALVLVMSSIIIVGAHLIFSTVIGERKDKTLPFLMGLPVNYNQYTSAKLIVNLVGFVIPWAILTCAMLAIILVNDTLKDGLVPFFSIVLTELLVAHVLILATAMITESEAWSIVVMTICNISVSLFSMFVSGFSDINQFMQSDDIVWNSTSITMLVLEVIVILLLVGVIYAVQSRKTDFL